jgi:YVTN family beta-propeller protein
MAMHSSLRWLSVGAVMALIAVVACLAGNKAETSAQGKEPAKARLRRPVALALADKGRWLFVANRGSGTVSVIDMDKARVSGETEVGRQLADLALTPNEKHLLAVDEQADELIVLTRSGPALQVVARLTVGTSPVSVRPTADGKQCMVTSLWSRQLAVVDLTALDNGNTKPVVKKSVGLPFAPRMLLPVSNTSKVIVADSFAGKLAVVDVAKGRVDSVRTLPAHQIRGLAWSSDGKQLLLTHQVLHADAHTTQADIHWGNLIVNYVRALSSKDLLDPDADLLKGSRLFPLGDVGHGTGDPAGLAVCPDGSQVVALAGVAQIALGSDKTDWTYLDVGRRPTAVAVDAGGRRVFVANTFSDSVTVVDVARKEKEAEIALGPQPELSRSERGEMLFSDARLSHEGWLSCNSCHVDGHTNGLLNDNLSDGSFGTPKRVLSLLGVKDTAPWAWNGSVTDLKDQVRKSLEITMRGAKPTDEQVQDLEAYLRTLSPPPPLQPETAANKAAFRRGKDVFNQQGCGNCHAPPIYTSAKTYDVGLADEAGNKSFNPPSLRGVGQGGPYFHDNRASTLEDVFTAQRHQLKKELTKEELGDLVSFLRSL